MPLHPPSQRQLGLSNNWNCHLGAVGPSHCHLGNSYATIPASLTGSCTHSATAPSTLTSDSYRSRSINSLPQYFSFSSTSFICTSDVLLTWVSEGPSRAFSTLVFLRYPDDIPGVADLHRQNIWILPSLFSLVDFDTRETFTFVVSCVLEEAIPIWLVSFSGCFAWFSHRLVESDIHSFLYYLLQWTCWPQAGSYWK